MLANLRQLFSYRGLIQILVTRELKARYHGGTVGVHNGRTTCLGRLCWRARTALLDVLPHLTPAKR